MIQHTGMTQATGLLEVSAARLRGHVVTKVTMSCAHGRSTYVLLPGRDPAVHAAALDFLWVRRLGRHGCECADPDRASGHG